MGKKLNNDIGVYQIKKNYKRCFRKLKFPFNNVKLIGHSLHLKLESEGLAVRAQDIC